MAAARELPINTEALLKDKTDFLIDMVSFVEICLNCK